MTNVYNGLINNVEQALGGLQRHDTEQALAKVKTPLADVELLRVLQDANPALADWQQELAQLQLLHQQEHPKETIEYLPNLMEAKDIARKIIKPVFSRDTRTNYYTRAGGNVMSGMTDLWVQQDQLEKNDELRQAHIVEYDLINMEAVLMACEKMLDAINEENHGKRRRKTTPMGMTDGYIRIINGLVYESFAEELQHAGMEDVANRIHPVRLSNGDEFRLVVVGLDEDEIAHASKVAQQKVRHFVSRIGFDALPHLKHLKDAASWNALKNLEDLENDPELFKAYQYGGAGIKIGSAELGLDRSTPEIEEELDEKLHESREQRARVRGRIITRGIEASKDKSPDRPPVKLFNRGNKLSLLGLGNVIFANHQSFKEAFRVIKEDGYQGYYRRPEVETLDFPYKINEERYNAYPYNNPDEYIDEFIQIISNYVGLTDHVKKRMEHELREAFTQPLPSNGHPPENNLAKIVMDTAYLVLEEAPVPSETQDVLKARAQYEEKSLLLRESLETYAAQWNAYESFDLTRKRVLDREAERLNLTPAQRELLFYKPLALANARHQDGYCMSGRTKESLQIFQTNDQEPRQFSYIGLSSFAGVNEVSSALARSINDEIRHIASDELKKRFGRKVLDFAFAVQSGRLNILTHGISRNELTSALSEIECRVDREINQVPIGNLMKRYRVFQQHKHGKAIVPKDEYHEDMKRIMDEVSAAQDKYGHQVPLVFAYSTEGEVTARPLTPEECDAQQDAISAGKRLFLEEFQRVGSLAVPKQVHDYLKSVGYHDEEGNIDLEKPLAILPNAKHTHEHGVRVITAYVELLGNSPRLADQRKDELFRLVEHKKRTLYEPGKGYEVPIPIEAMPNLSIPEEKQKEAQSAIARSIATATAANGVQGTGKFTGVSRNNPKDTKEKPSGPKDQAAWLRELDRIEFSMLRQYSVPEALLQMVTDPYLGVEHAENDQSYTIHVRRQEKSPFGQTAYDRETVEAPRRRAEIYKQSLEAHFGTNVITVTGLSLKNRGNREIMMRVRPSALSGKRNDTLEELTPTQQRLQRFFDELCAIKERQYHPEEHKDGIAVSLQREVDKYRYQLRAINVMRHFPTMIVDIPNNKGKDFIVKLPQEPGERKSVWKKRNDDLLKELRSLFKDKAVEFEEASEIPRLIRTGGNSTRARAQYLIRVESNSVSNDIVEFMASLQQPASIRQSGWRWSR